MATSSVLFFKKFKMVSLFKIILLVFMVGTIILLAHLYTKIASLEYRSVVLEATVAYEEKLAYLLENVDPEILQLGLNPLFDVKIEPVIEDPQKSKTIQMVIVIIGTLLILWVLLYGFFLPRKE